MIASFSQQFTVTAENVSQDTLMVSKSLQSIASGSENQVQSSMETETTMEETSIGIQRIAEHSSEISASSIEALSQAKHSTEAIQTVIAKMQHINDLVGKAEAGITRLEINSQDIVQIVGLIGGVPT